MKKDIIVIESYDKDMDVHWGVSFTDHNPEQKDYVECASKEDAFKLKDIILG